MILATQDNTCLMEEFADLTVIEPFDRVIALPWEDEEEPTVLVVEDDPHISLALSIRLKNEGYKVVPAADAAAGLQRAVSGPKVPDLILLDIMLPGVDGITVAETLLAQDVTQDVPMIFMTGSQDPCLRNRVQGLGAAGFFEKPYEINELIKAIERLL